MKGHEESEKVQVIYSACLADQTWFHWRKAQRGLREKRTIEMMTVRV